MLGCGGRCGRESVWGEQGKCVGAWGEMRTDVGKGMGVWGK